MRLAAVKGVTLSEMRGLFQQCSLPEESAAWVDAIERREASRRPYREIVETLKAVQETYKYDAVEYSVLRYALGARTPPIPFGVEELRSLCQAMSVMARGYISTTQTTVELDQSPENVINAIETATKTVTNKLSGRRTPAKTVKRVSVKK